MNKSQTQSVDYTGFPYQSMYIKMKEMFDYMTYVIHRMAESLAKRRK